jgi:hypothetical protein
MRPDTIFTKNGVTKAYTGNTRPKEVYVLRSDKDLEDSGVWHKVFMCYSANTVMMAEFENGIIDNTVSFNYKEAREYWNKMIRKDINMHRDDTCIKGLPLGDVKL